MSSPAAWRTGANVETKLLMLEHAFEPLPLLEQWLTEAGRPAWVSREPLRS